ALMVENPFSRFIGNLNILGLSAMVMTRFSALTNFAIAAGSAVVLNEFSRKKISHGQFVKPLLLVLSMAVVPLAIMLFIWRLWAPTIPPSPIDFFPPEVLSFPNTLMVSFRNSLLPIFQIIISLFFVLLTVKIFRARKPAFLLTLFFVLTFLDFYRFFTKYNSFTPRSYLYPENKISQFLLEKEGRFITSRDPIMPPNMWLVDGLDSINGQDTLHSIYYNQVISLINFADLNRVTDRFIQVGNFDSPLLDFLNVKYILALKWKEGRPDTAGIPNYPLDDPTKFPVVFADGLTAVIERKNSLPPVFSVASYALAKDLKEEQKLLEEKNLSQIVILDQAPQIEGSLTQAKIDPVSQKGNEIVFDTQSTGNSLVVLSTAFYPGWNYYLDGVKQDPPLRANHAFLAVPLPPGEHAVRLVYLPASFKLGLIIAAVSFFVLILFLFSHIIRSLYERRSSRQI
ncbi:MAG: YfhO family protein, partial [Microgenomates group bacterium]